ncbi:MAG: DUF4912 domain-containing protein [Candidatus Omnitrophica bacterium]|nr:DUF4912 domain-containing protein [Candidatus Omnitrophota bacterium]
MAILRKIKAKIKKVSQVKRKPKIARGSLKKIKAAKVAPPVEKKEIMGQQETAIGKTKFYTAEAPRPTRAMPQELPELYGQDKIVLQVRDPRWIHAYWEVTSQTYEKLRNQLKDEFYRARRILRVYDVSQIIFNGNNAHRFFDIQIGDSSTNWYIDTNGPGRSWCVDLGLLLPDGRFITIVRSNTVSMPIEGPSWVTDEEWLIPDDMFARLYGMGFGLGKSSPIGKAWQERIKRELFSGSLSSAGISSVASPTKKAPAERKFWMVVNTELIVYGATEPDAKVYVQDKQINLRHDGTFSMRFALPDGKQVIPVKAVSSDNKEERKITPIVTKETK